MLDRRTAIVACSLAFTHLAASADFLDWYNGAKLGSILPEDDAVFPNGIPSQSSKLILIDFWATWCAPCREQIPKLNAWHQRYAPKGLSIVGVTKETPDIVAAFMERTQMDYPVAVGMKRSLQDSLGIKALPYAVFARRDRKIIWRGQPQAINDALIESLLQSGA